MASYATISDLQTYWGATFDTERAELLLSIASARLRVIAESEKIDLDVRASDKDYAEMLKWVVMEATKRALNTPVDTPPVDTYSQTAGPYSENFKFSNPSGDLWFRKSELQTLGLSGNQQFVSIKPATRGNIYGE